MEPRPPGPELRPASPDWVAVAHRSPDRNRRAATSEPGQQCSCLWNKTQRGRSGTDLGPRQPGDELLDPSIQNQVAGWFWDCFVAKVLNVLGASGVLVPLLTPTDLHAAGIPPPADASRNGSGSGVTTVTGSPKQDLFSFFFTTLSRF